MKYLTPDAPTGDSDTCYVLRFPDTTDFRSLVDGALASLVFESSWREHGTLSRQDTAQIFKLMLLNAEHRCMIGSIVPVVTADVPEWGLLCNGATYSRAAYPKLWAALHPAFKTDDFFSVPDLRSKTLVGAKSTGGEGWAMAEYGGEIEHTLTAHEMPEHYHTSPPHGHTDIGHNHYYSAPGVTLPVVAPGEVPVLAPNFLGGFTATGYASLTQTSVTTNPTGDGQPHNNMPPFMALNFVIVWK